MHRRLLAYACAIEVPRASIYFFTLSSRQEGNDFVSSFEFRLVTAIWHLYPFAFFKFLPVGQ